MKKNFKNSNKDRVRQQIVFKPKAFEEVAEMARVSGAKSFNAFVRMAIDEWINNHKNDIRIKLIRKHGY